MDENIVYFRNILPQLRGIYLHEVWEKILRMISRRVHSTVLYPSDWKDFAAEIGINDGLVLEEIEISATINKELPLSIAFCGPLQYKYTLYDIIQALINLERADVLCLIREEFEDFWDGQQWKMHQRNACTSNHSNCAVTHGTLTVQLPEDNPLLRNKDPNLGGMQSRNETKTSSFESVERQSAMNLNHSSGKQNGDELTSKEGNKDCSITKDSFPFKIVSLDHNKKLSNIPFIECKSQKTDCPRNYEVVLEGDKPTAPSTPLDTVTVFIIYLACEIATGIRLANQLRQAGLRVITLSEAEVMIRIDRSGFLKTLLEKVDFVIPIICEEYMLCVRPDKFCVPNNNNDKKTNRFIFTWIHTEYENNACFNFRVKPVVVEKFDWHLIGNEPIFQWVHELWTEVGDLVKLLHDTKRMIKNLMELWNQEMFVEHLMNFLNQN